MITDNELYILNERTDATFVILVDKIVNFFDSIDYLLYSDELSDTIDNYMNLEITLREAVDNILNRYLNNVSIILGIEFTTESTLSERYFVLKNITDIPNIIPSIKASLADYLMTDESDIEQLTNILNFISETSIDFYMVIEKVTIDLMDNISEVLNKNIKDEIDIYKHIKLYKLNKAYKNITGTNPKEQIVQYVRHNDNIHLELLISLFKDSLNVVDSETLLNVVFTLLVFSDVEESFLEEAYVKYFPKYVNGNILSLIDTKIINYINKFKDV